jgi:hypothetical protein
MTSFALGNPYGVNNVIVPKGGPKIAPARLDFGTTAEIVVNGLEIVSNGNIEFLQGMFIDNADNIDPLICTMSDGTGQRIICPARGQGYFSMLQPNPPIIRFATPQMVGRVINVAFYNVPIQSQVWLTA